MKLKETHLNNPLQNKEFKAHLKICKVQKLQDPLGIKKTDKYQKILTKRKIKRAHLEAKNVNKQHKENKDLKNKQQYFEHKKQYLFGFWICVEIVFYQLISIFH